MLTTSSFSSWQDRRTKKCQQICQQNDRRTHNSPRTLSQLRHYSLASNFGPCAFCTAEDIDSQNGVLVYRRKKLGPFSEPCTLTIGNKLRFLLEVLPSSGDLFPNIKSTSANHRSAEFSRRCRIAGVSGIRLHSYRHAWAQRAKACGYPQRFAQEALGHSSRTVHEAYAKGAFVLFPLWTNTKQWQLRKSSRCRD